MCISISGQVVQWKTANSEEISISEQEASIYEAKGYMVVSLKGNWIAIKLQPWPDGTIEIQPKSSWLAKEFAKGSHTNYGYGGYFTGYLWVEGKRRRLIDFWKLLPDQEHHYDQQGLKAEAIARIESIVEEKKGMAAHKVKGGWSLFASDQ